MLESYTSSLYKKIIKSALDLISDKTSFYPNVKKIKMKGCYSLMVGMDKSLQLDFDAAFIENKDIAWLALNNSKPSRMKNHCLLINSSMVLSGIILIIF